MHSSTREGLSVRWTYDCTESRIPTLRTKEFYFQDGSYCFEFILHSDEEQGYSKLSLVSADGTHRRLSRPIDVQVLVWGSRNSSWSGEDAPRACSLLIEGTVSEVPWTPDYDKKLLSGKVTIGHRADHFMWYQVEFLSLLESTPAYAARNGDSSAQTEIAGLTSDSAFPSDLDSLSLDLANLLKNETLPDVRLKCGSNRTVPAHRAVLAARSEVFEAMFRNEMAESRTGEVDLVDVQDDVIDPFLEYVYSGQIPSGVPDDALPGLYAAADKYAVQSLRDTCRDKMADLLTEENCVHFLTVADAHGDDDFKKSVVEFICSHSAIFRSEAWMDFAKKPTPLAIEVYQSFIVEKTGHASDESE